MAERILLCIEPDSATVDEIRSELGPYGFTIESIANGDDAIEWGRSIQPSLIILSVEPRKVGYAICNKLKRSPSLREVPLVLISAEETLATFEQHKKLKSRADEYLLKPLDMSDLIAKVDQLVGLGGKQQKTDEMDVQELDADADIVIADDEDIAIIGSEDESWTTTRRSRACARARPGPTSVPAEDTREQPVPAGFGTAPPTRTARPSRHHPSRAEKFDPETQAEFAALEAGRLARGAHGRARQRHGGSAQPLVRRRSAVGAQLGSGHGDDGGRQGPGRARGGPALRPRPDERRDDDRAIPTPYRTGQTLGPDFSGTSTPAPTRTPPSTPWASRTSTSRPRPRTWAST